mmetsp:Transcript_21737/g.34601  ORF Transcript_21737/g.34601 Transcript_21737/m.34601 type:complete len:86 (-) Transcript_21737:95-352(-)
MRNDDELEIIILVVTNPQKKRLNAREIAEATLNASRATTYCKDGSERREENSNGLPNETSETERIRLIAHGNNPTPVAFVDNCSC